MRLGVLRQAKARYSVMLGAEARLDILYVGCSRDRYSVMLG